MGTPEFAVRPLEYLVANDYEVVAVYTQPDRTAGRGRALGVSPVKRAAEAHGLDIVQPPSLKDEGVVQALLAVRPEVIVIAAYGQFLTPQVLAAPAHRCLNIHPSLLPKYRGVSPVPAAILAGDEFTGVSIMLPESAGWDTGPVIARAQIPVADRDTTGTLTDKLSRIGAQLLVDVLPRWVRGQIEPQLQDHSLANYAKKIKKEDGDIEWTHPAVEVWRRVRAYSPWPGAYTRWQGRQLKIIDAVPLPASERASPGQVVNVTHSEAGFGVSTGAGVLGVITLQLEGKRAMSAADFLRGQRDFGRAVLPS